MKTTTIQYRAERIHALCEMLNECEARQRNCEKQLLNPNANHRWYHDQLVRLRAIQLRVERRLQTEIDKLYIHSSQNRIEPDLYYKIKQ